MFVADPQSKPFIKFGMNRTKRSEVTNFLKFSYILRWRAADILDFQFDYFQGNTVVWDADRNMLTKFGENPTYRSKVIGKIVFHWICEFVIRFVNFKMAVGGHLEFSRMLSLTILACNGCWGDC